MLSVTGKWIGTTQGTHPHNVFIEFNNVSGKISCDLRLSPPNNLIVRKFIGLCEQDETTIYIKINEISDVGFKNSAGNIWLKPNSEIILDGEYELTTGEKGIFNIKKYFSALIPEKSEPFQIFPKEYRISYPLKIFKKDIFELIKKLKQLVTTAGTVTIIETSDSQGITHSADAYLKYESHIETPTCLKLIAHYPPQGLSNITLTFNRYGDSFIFAQSPEEIWSNLAINSVKPYLESKRNKLLEIFKKHGLELNGMLLLAFIALLPNVSTTWRFIWIAVLVFFVYLYRKEHRYISQTLIQQNDDFPKKFEEKRPILGFLINISKNILKALIPAILGATIQYLHYILRFIDHIHSHFS